MHTHVCVHGIVLVWRSKGTWQESVPSFSYLALEMELSSLRLMANFFTH